MEKYKKAAIASSSSRFQNQRKLYKVYNPEIIRTKFHHNLSSLWAVALTHTYRQTHARTYIYIHTHSVRLQHIQSKLLNIKTAERITTAKTIKYWTHKRDSLNHNLNDL